MSVVAIVHGNVPSDLIWLSLVLFLVAPLEISMLLATTPIAIAFGGVSYADAAPLYGTYSAALIIVTSAWIALRIIFRFRNS